MTHIPVYVFPLIFLSALLYASVGHGGASGYLALMALLGISLSFAKPVALILNCFVSLVAFIQFYRSGYFNMRLFAVLASASIPFAYVGGMIDIDGDWYKRILGVVLLFSAARLVWPVKENTNPDKPPIVLLLISGAAIGFLSGLIGIGGGIILTPLLLLAGWSGIKEAASVSALFIFVNSLSGLAAQLQKGVSLHQQMYYMVGIALIGGLTGSYFGAKHWNAAVLKTVLSIVLLIASFKLIFI